MNDSLKLMITLAKSLEAEGTTSADWDDTVDIICTQVPRDVLQEFYGGGNAEFEEASQDPENDNLWDLTETAADKLQLGGVCYVSGHLDLSKEEFAEHYEPKIRAAHKRGYSFVVGDARGCDNMTQALLVDLNSAIRESGGTYRGVDVRIFHMLEEPRYNRGTLTQRAQKDRLVGGFTSDEARDAAMTAASDFDIAWVRPGRENSGTAKNLARRKR